jgi:hypothetical protein
MNEKNKKIYIIFVSLFIVFLLLLLNSVYNNYSIVNPDEQGVLIYLFLFSLFMFIPCMLISLGLFKVIYWLFPKFKIEDYDNDYFNENIFTFCLMILFFVLALNGIERISHDEIHNCVTSDLLIGQHKIINDKEGCYKIYNHTNYDYEVQVKYPLQENMYCEIDETILKSFKNNKITIIDEEYYCELCHDFKCSYYQIEGVK